MSTTNFRDKYADDFYRVIPLGFTALALLNFLLDRNEIWFGRSHILSMGSFAMPLFLPYLTLAWVVASFAIALTFRYYRPISYIMTCFIVTSLPLLYAISPPMSAVDIVLQR